MNRYLWSTILFALLGALLLLPACAADAQYEIHNQAGRSFAVVYLESAGETSIEACTDVAARSTCTVAVPSSQVSWIAVAADLGPDEPGDSGCWISSSRAVAEPGAVISLSILADLTSSSVCVVSGSVCESTCATAGDGECDDGGLGALYDVCDLGTDCVDCGARAP